MSIGGIGVVMEGGAGGPNTLSFYFRAVGN